MERPAIPEGPPHGGPEGDGFCCGVKTHDDKYAEENRGQHHSLFRWYVEGVWQCHVREDHHGKLLPTPIIVTAVFPGEIGPIAKPKTGLIFELQMKREVNGESDGTDWRTFDSPLFSNIRTMFDHPLLEEVTLSYQGNVDMRFRKKPYDAEGQ